MMKVAKLQITQFNFDQNLIRPFKFSFIQFEFTKFQFYSIKTFHHNLLSMLLLSA